MVLVHTPKITPRLKYIFKQLFLRTLNIDVSFTTKVDAFVAHNGPKLSYGKAPLGIEFFIRSHDLLFEQGINDIEINMLNWDDVPCFFPAGDPSSIPFDIFAASFYLISRYEEYLPHVQDEHERFPAHESLAYQNGFLEKPVVDIWAYKFLEHFKKKFPDLVYQEREFQLISTVDVNTAFAYKNKGLIRTIGAFGKDIFRLRFLNLYNRFMTIFNFRKDHFDNFSQFLQIKKQYNVKTLFFFLVGDYTTFDKNISFSNSSFRSLIKSVTDYAKIGIKPSYFTLKNTTLLKKEVKRLEDIINTPIMLSRQHYLRMILPETYQNLIDVDITEDYSMGYAKAVGFRASTCTPFYFYDLDFEIQTPLKVFSFALRDTSLKYEMKLSNEASMAKIMELKNAVKNVNGTFISLVHNESLSENSNWRGWTTIYKQMVIDTN